MDISKTSILSIEIIKGVYEFTEITILSQTMENHNNQLGIYINILSKKIFIPYEVSEHILLQNRYELVLEFLQPIIGSEYRLFLEKLLNRHTNLEKVSKKLQLKPPL